MIHNSFRRIALAQGLLPERGQLPDPAVRDGLAGTDLDTGPGSVRNEAGRHDGNAGYRPPSPAQPIHPSERQIQV